MSKNLYGQLLGNPQIFLGEQPVFFAFSKINGLLYYLLVNKLVSRDEMAGLLWPNMAEKNAKKNLRNAIYQANKQLGAEYICSPNNMLLVLNDDLVISSDIELFKDNVKENLALYQGSFLKGFALKETEEYDLWVLRMRSFFEKKFVNEGYRKVTEDMANYQYQEVEKNIAQLIEIDSFDERNYQILMNYYQQIGRHDQVIEVYYQLADTLNMELGIDPSSETRTVFDASLAVVNKQLKRTNRRFTTPFFGRLAEIKLLETTFKNFATDQEASSILIKGEAGIGKTSLVKRVLDNTPHFHILETQCYEAENSFELRPWHALFNQLSNLLSEQPLQERNGWHAVLAQFFPNIDELFHANAFENEKVPDLNKLSQVLIESIRQVSQGKKLVIYFENIQWLDEMSFQLLTSLMIHLKNKEALFVFTLQDEARFDYSEILAFISLYAPIEQIELAQLTFSEMKAFVRQEMDPQVVSETRMKELYSLTEGNFYFVTEYLNMLRNNDQLDIMNVRMQDTLRSRFTHLSKQERQLVELISYFYDHVSLSFLAQNFSWSQSELAEGIENLVNDSLLIERQLNEEILVSFSHNRLREFIYMNQTLSKKRLFHAKIAHLMETTQNLTDDPIMLIKTAYHYEKGGDSLKALEFQLSYLQRYFTFYHELFPTKSLPNLTNEGELVKWKKGSIDEFSKIQQKLNQLKPQVGDSRDFQLVQLKFYLLKGRYLIKQGGYLQGVADIQQVIILAKQLDESRYLLEGYKQMVYYCIQIDDSREMLTYVELGLSEAIQSNNHEAIGILLRLKGLNYLMTGKLSLAEQTLNESINTFTLTAEIKEKYNLNIAAAYDYLAEIRSIEENYDAAIELQNQAILLSEGQGAYSTVSVFYINMGIILFAKEDYQQAEVYFMQAYKIFEEFSSLWKRPQLDVYMSLINLFKGNYHGVFDYLISSKKYVEQFANSRNLGTIYFAEAIIKRQLITTNQDDKQLLELLKHDQSYYLRKALDFLSPNRNKLELTLLQRYFEID